MSSIKNRWSLLALAGALILVSTGCQSGGGSRWAWWNPMARASEDTSLVARSAPELPSDTATPLVEGIQPPTTTVAQAASSPSAPVSVDVPKIETASPATVAPTYTPAAEAAKIAARPLPTAPTTTPAPKSAPSYSMAAIPPIESKAPPAATPAGGPYDPNAYQASATAVAQATATVGSGGGRYGGNTLGNRYATATPAEGSLPDFRNSPAPTASYRNNAPAPPGLGNRYASTAPVAKPTAPAAPASQPTMPPVQPLPAPTSLASAEPASPASSRLPDAALPQAQAIATTSPASSASPSVQLTSAPGAYRPGGTSSYRSPVSVATKPEPVVAPSTSPVSPYPSTGSQLR